MKILKLILIAIAICCTACERTVDPYVSESLIIKNQSTQTIHLISHQFSKHLNLDSIIITPNNGIEISLYDSNLVWLNHNNFSALIKEIKILVPNDTVATQHFQMQISNSNNWETIYDTASHYWQKVTVIKHNFVFTKK